MSNIADTYGSISFSLEGGVQFQGTPIHVSMYEIVFEVVAPEVTLRASQVIDSFVIRLDELTSRKFRATITSVTQTGTVAVCVASVEDGWMTDVDQSSWRIETGAGTEAFRRFICHWQKQYYVSQEFKVLVADMQTYLTDFRFWCEMVENEARSRLKDGQSWAEKLIELAKDLGASSTDVLNELFRRFELLASKAEEGNRQAYRLVARRFLHPFLLCAPFLYRTYTKPLGYAGDYEMVNMISREPFEGATLFAKLMNVWFLRQAPAEAHRNRLVYLRERISDSVIKAFSEGRTARIYNLGCGPAVELQDFLRGNRHTGEIELILVDFNEETLAYSKSQLEKELRSNLRPVRITFEKKSVNQVLKEAARLSPVRFGEPQFDFVYCAGLYDYLSNSVCRLLSTRLYQLVRPGGLLATTNVDSSNPWRLVMDFVMDWHLIYRNSDVLMGTRPDDASVEDCKILSDYSGVNIYFEARKPDVR